MERTVVELIKYDQRHFATDLSVGEAPFLIERLRGTPVRVQELIKELSDEVLNFKPGGKWSILEHLDHLRAADIEFAGRISQYLE